MDEYGDEQDVQNKVVEEEIMWPSARSPSSAIKQQRSKSARNFRSFEAADEGGDDGIAWASQRKPYRKENNDNNIFGETNGQPGRAPAVPLAYYDELPAAGKSSKAGYSSTGPRGGNLSSMQNELSALLIRKQNVSLTRINVTIFKSCKFLDSLKTNQTKSPPSQEINFSFSKSSNWRCNWR